jgi:hypothetical protein
MRKITHLSGSSWCIFHPQRCRPLMMEGESTTLRRASPCYQNHTIKEVGRQGSGTCTDYLDHPFKTRPFETEKDLFLLLANTGRWVYNQSPITAYSYSNNDTLTCWRSCFYGSHFNTSPASEGELTGYVLLSLCSLDETTQDLPAALLTHRSWQKQGRAHRRKRAHTPTTHHSQARVETPILTRTDRL